MIDLANNGPHTGGKHLSATEIKAILGDRATDEQVAVLQGFIEQVGGVEEARQAMATLQALTKKAA